MSGSRLLLACLLLGASVIATAQVISSTATYSFLDREAVTFSTVGVPPSVLVGYARVQPGGGTTAPAAFAVLGYTANSVLVSQTSVPGTIPVTSGRIYAEVNGPLNTSVAFVNPNLVPVTVSYFFTDSNGNTVAPNNFVLDAGAQRSRFLSEAPFNMSGFTGTVTFNASSPVVVSAFRSVTNSRNELLFTNEPLASTVIINSNPFVIAHFADGGGWKTEVVLVNPTDQRITGTVEFFGQGTATAAALPLTLTVNGVSGASFGYSIPSRSAVKLETFGPGTTVRVGSVHVTPSTGSNAPSGFAMFSLSQRGVVVTQATAAADAASPVHRMFVQSIATFDTQPISTGIAIANTSVTPTTVSLELTTDAGVSTGQAALLTVPGSGHVSVFLDQIFPFQLIPPAGMLRISAISSPLVVAGFLSRYNQRGDFLMTTTPVSNEFSTSITGDLIIPQFAEGGGYTTQFVLFSGTRFQSGLGVVQFLNPFGQLMNVTLQ